MDYFFFKTELIPHILEGKKVEARQPAEEEGGCPYGKPGDKFAIMENMRGMEIYTGHDGEITRTWLEVGRNCFWGCFVQSYQCQQIKTESGDCQKWKSAERERYRASPKR